MKKYYSTEIANHINKTLENIDIKFKFDEESGVFFFGVSLDGDINKIDYIIDVKRDAYVVYAICPLSVRKTDSTKMAQMAEFVCRANYNLLNGNFELDFEDGEIRYKSYVDCEELIPSEDVIINSIHCPAAMYDRYSEGITGVIYANLSAEEAIDKCESSDVIRKHIADAAKKLVDSPVIKAAADDLAEAMKKRAEALSDTDESDSQEETLEEMQKQLDALFDELFGDIADSDDSDEDESDADADTASGFKLNLFEEGDDE